MKSLPIKTQAKERLGNHLLVDSTILSNYSQESPWRTFFLRGKMRIVSELDIPVMEALP